MEIVLWSRLLAGTRTASSCFLRAGSRVLSGLTGQGTLIRARPHLPPAREPHLLGHLASSACLDFGPVSFLTNTPTGALRRPRTPASLRSPRLLGPPVHPVPRLRRLAMPSTIPSTSFKTFDERLALPILPSKSWTTWHVGGTRCYPAFPNVPFWDICALSRTVRT